MSRSIIIALVGLIFIILLGALFFFMFASREELPSADIVTPSPEQNPSPTTPSEESYSGEVIDVSETEVGFKNSLLVTVSAESGNILFYLPEDVIVTNEDEEVINREDIVIGDVVDIIGVPISGGIEAREVQVRTVESVVLTPVESGEITITPTPTDSI